MLPDKIPIFVALLAVSAADVDFAVPDVVGRVVRTPEDGVVKLHGPGSGGSQMKCSRVDDAGERLVSDVSWFIVDDDAGYDSEVDLGVNSATLDAADVDGDEDVTIRCKIGAEGSADFRIFRKNREKRSFRVKKFKKSYDVEIQMDEEFTCEILNRTMNLEDLLPDLEITWFRWKEVEDFTFRTEAASDDNCTDDGRWVRISGTEVEEGDLEPHVQVFEKQRVLKIEDARYSDRRGYKCVARNATDRTQCSESSFFVRVKDRYAPLWPFLGIVAEVIILASVIFICEKKRASKDLSTDDDEEYNGNAVSSSAGTSNSQVRQRRS